MTRGDFDRVLGRMSGLRFVPSDLGTHWRGLSTIPLNVLEGAVDAAIRSQSDFPTPSELRVYCDTVARPSASSEAEDRSEPLPEPVTVGTLPTGTVIRADRHWRYYCEQCNDSGVRDRWCGEGPGQPPWLIVQSCGRPAGHYGHTWIAGRCICYDTNPEIQRRLAHQAKYAASGAQRKAN